MNTVAEVFVGVDVSKDHLDIHILPSGKYLRIANTEKAIKKFAEENLDQQNVKRVICEASGGYEGTLKSTLKSCDYRLRVVDPRRVKAFRIASGRKCKSDKSDAKLIAEFSVASLSEYEPFEKTENQELLHVLNSRKRDLKKFIAEEKTRLKQAIHQPCKPSIQRSIEFLEKEIDDLEQQIKAIVKRDQELTKKAELLVSIPGIGFASAALLLSSVPELGTLNKKEIGALVGVVPYENSSGNFNGKRYIRGGRMMPRNALYMCAITCISHNAPLQQFYNRLIEAKKAFKVAIVAVMRKLIIIANTVLKRGQPWYQ